MTTAPKTLPTAAAKTCLRRRKACRPGIIHRRLQITAVLYWNNHFGIVRWRRAERVVRCGCRELGVSLPSLRARRVRGQPLWSSIVSDQRRVQASRDSSAGPSAAPGSARWLGAGRVPDRQARAGELVRR